MSSAVDSALTTKGVFFFSTPSGFFLSLCSWHKLWGNTNNLLKYIILYKNPVIYRWILTIQSIRSTKGMKVKKLVKHQMPKTTFKMSMDLWQHAWCQTPESHRTLVYRCSVWHYNTCFGAKWAVSPTAQARCCGKGSGGAWYVGLVGAPAVSNTGTKSSALLSWAANSWIAHLHIFFFFHS